MRTIVSILVACALFVLVGYLAYSGIIILSDFWTGVAVVLVATALGVLYWGFRPQIGGLFKEKVSEDESEAETVSARYPAESEEKPVEGTIRQPVPPTMTTLPSEKKEMKGSALLPDNTKITKLNITSDFLDQIYEQAHRRALEIYDDAQLSEFTIQANPFSHIGPYVFVYLKFYAKFADKTCTFRYSDLTPQVEHAPPDKHVKLSSSKQVFTALPWKTSPQWLHFLERVYAKIGPLSSTPGTIYHLLVSPDYWQVSFEDGLSGNERKFEWNGSGLDEKNIRELD